MSKTILFLLILMLNLYSSNLQNLPILIDNSNYKIYVRFDGNLAFIGCYADAFKFNNNGFAPVSVDGNEWSFINDKGQKRNNKTFDSIDSYASNGLAVAVKDGQYGYIDINCQWIIKPKFDEAYKFDSIENNISLAMAWIDEKHGYIDISGQWIIKPIFASHYDTGFENGVALVSPVNSSLYGMIDYNGKWILEPKYGWNTAGDVKTHKGHFTLMDKGRWGVVNSKGIWVIKPNYDFILGATANGYAVKLNNKEIFIDLKIKYKKETDKTNEIKKMNKNYTYGNSNLIISKKLGDLLIKTNNCEDFLKQVKKTFPNLK